MIQWFKRRSWQDLIFAVGEVVFIIGLIPTVLATDKPSVWTSFPTAAMLCAFIAVQVSYKNWMTVTLTSGAAALWFVLGVQAL